MRKARAEEASELGKRAGIVPVGDAGSTAQAAGGSAARASESSGTRGSIGVFVANHPLDGGGGGRFRRSRGSAIGSGGAGFGGAVNTQAAYRNREKAPALNAAEIRERWVRTRWRGRGWSRGRFRGSTGGSLGESGGRLLPPSGSPTRWSRGADGVEAGPGGGAAGRPTRSSRRRWRRGCRLHRRLTGERRGRPRANAGGRGGGRGGAGGRESQDGGASAVRGGARASRREAGAGGTAVLGVLRRPTSEPTRSRPWSPPSGAEALHVRLIEAADCAAGGTAAGASACAGRTTLDRRVRTRNGASREQPEGGIPGRRRRRRRPRRRTKRRGDLPRCRPAGWTRDVAPGAERPAAGASSGSRAHGGTAALDAADARREGVTGVLTSSPYVAAARWGPGIANERDHFVRPLGSTSPAPWPRDESRRPALRHRPVSCVFENFGRGTRRRRRRAVPEPIATPRRMLLLRRGWILPSADVRVASIKRLCMRRRVRGTWRGKRRALFARPAAACAQLHDRLD